MAQVKISELPSASALTGSEVLPVVQGGSTLAATVNQIKDKIQASTINVLKMNASSVQTLANIGELAFNPDTQTLEVKCSADVTLSIGQENYIRGKNAESSTILNGTVVYVSGGLGANSLIKRAGNADGTAERVIGVATQDIGANNIGFITTSGVVNKVDTSAYIEGDLLWLGTNGAMTNVKPNTSVDQICIGVVLRSHATEGSFLVSVKDDWRDKLAEVRSDLNEKLEEKPDLLDTVEDGFYICDSLGNVLIRLDVLDTKSNIGVNLASAIKTIVNTKMAEGVSVLEANEIGENLHTLISDIANDGGLQETIEDGFFMCNDKKEVIAKYIDGKWDFSGAVFSTINNGFVYKRGNISTGQTWVLANNAVKNGKRKSFSGNLIGAFSSIIIGHSNGGTSDTSYVVIDNTNITSYIQNVAQAPIAHGINIANNLQVSLVQDNGHLAKIKVTSNGYTSTEKIITWIGSNGNIYLTSNSDFSDASFGWCCTKLNNGIWLFGDSYFSLADTARWTSYLIANGFTNLMFDGYGGRDSSAAYSSVINLLKIATPRKIVWCLGMNDPDTENAVNVSWHTKLENLKAICAVNNIELILATIPTAVGRYTEGSGTTSMQINKFKNAIVRASGYRYIDFDKAVGADENTGAWLNDGLVNDFLEDRINGIIHTRIHPTTFGAIALYHRAIADVPELMM